MSLSSSGELFQDLMDNQNYLSFIGNILVFFSTIFLDTIYKMLLISGTKMMTKVIMVAVLEPFSVENIPGIFQDF